MAGPDGHFTATHPTGTTDDIGSPPGQWIAAVQVARQGRASPPCQASAWGPIAHSDRARRADGAPNAPIHRLRYAQGTLPIWSEIADGHGTQSSSPRTGCGRRTGRPGPGATVGRGTSGRCGSARQKPAASRNSTAVALAAGTAGETSSPGAADRIQQGQAAGLIGGDGGPAERQGEQVVAEGAAVGGRDQTAGRPQRGQQAAPVLAGGRPVQGDHRLQVDRPARPPRGPGPTGAGWDRSG